MRLFLTALTVISAGIALVLGGSAMIFGIAYSSHFIKGDPDAPYFVHLWVGIQFALVVGGVPAVIAVALNCIRLRLPPD